MKTTRLTGIGSILLLAALLLGTVSPAIAASNHALNVLKTVYVMGKGLVIHFEADEAFKPGTVSVGEYDFSFVCNKHDSGAVACYANVQPELVGELATVSIAGETFTVVIPGPLGNSPFCYPIYDYKYYTRGSDAHWWEQIGTHCQKNEGQVGDGFEFYNSIQWNDFYDYEFFDNGLDACASVDFGPGYYYDDC